MNREAPIYPEVIIYAEKNYIIAKTTLRKKHRGKWYLQFHGHKWIIDGDESYAPSKDEIYGGKIETLKQLIKGVRLQQLFGTVNTKITDLNGNKLFILDTDQRPEEERIIDDFPYIKL